MPCAGGRGGHSPTRVSLASFSLHRAKRTKSRQRNLHHNLHQNNFLKFLYYLNKGRKNWPALRPRGPFFSARPEKEAKGAVSHGTSAAERLRHVKNSSANLPKLSRSRGFRHMGRFVFAPCRARQGQKFPNEPRSEQSDIAASAFRKLLNAQSAAGNARFLQPFVTWKAIAPQSGNDRPRQHCAKLEAWLVRGFPRAAGKRKGFLSEPP